MQSEEIINSPCGKEHSAAPNSHHVCFSIAPRPPGLSISLDHCSPALSGEHYGVTVSVVNEEATPITDLIVKIFLPEFLDESQPYSELHSACTELLPTDTIFAVEMYDSLPNAQSLPLPTSSSHHRPERQSLELTCSQLGCTGEKFTNKFYLCSQSTGSRKVNISVSFGCHRKQPVG